LELLDDYQTGHTVGRRGATHYTQRRNSATEVTQAWRPLTVLDS